MDSVQNHPNDGIEGSEDEFWPLSGKPYFNVIIKKTHVKPQFTLYVPAKVANLVPSVEVPVVFTYRGKKWQSRYSVFSRQGHARKTYIKWREFVIDNNLKEGDACVFEFTDYGNALIKIRVQILRGDFPSELLANVDGQNADKPIVI